MDGCREGDQMGLVDRVNGKEEEDKYQNDAKKDLKLQKKNKPMGKTKNNRKVKKEMKNESNP